jgi:hypothetical protein
MTVEIFVLLVGLGGEHKMVGLSLFPCPLRAGLPLFLVATDGNLEEAALCFHRVFSEENK